MRAVARPIAVWRLLHPATGGLHSIVFGPRLWVILCPQVQPLARVEFAHPVADFDGIAPNVRQTAFPAFLGSLIKGHVLREEDLIVVERRASAAVKLSIEGVFAVRWWRWARRRGRRWLTPQAARESAARHTRPALGQQVRISVRPRQVWALISVDVSGLGSAKSAFVSERIHDATRDAAR